MTMYSATIKWTSKDNGQCTVTGPRTEHEGRAWRLAVKAARLWGWPGNPKWWQIRRWGDDVIKKEYL